MDFYNQLRRRMIDTMQISLKSIRQVLGIGVQEFGDIVGLTRQSINNLETCKSKMSAVQFVSICAVIDHLVEAQPDIIPVVTSILNSNDTFHNDNVFENIEGGSFLKKWFMCFPDDSKLLSSNNNMIDNIVGNYRIFVDDTMLCEMVSENQIAELLDFLKKSGRRIIVPLKAVNYIQYQLLDKEDVVAAKAHNGISALTMLQNEGLVEFRGEESDINVMSTMLSVFAKFKAIHRLALITQNPKLAKAILLLNNDNIGGFQIMALRCSPNGMLEEWDFSEANDSDYSFDAENTEICNNENDETLSSLTGWDTI